MVTRNWTSLYTSVFSLKEQLRYKDGDPGWEIDSLPVGRFIESIYDLVDISVEGYDGLDDMVDGSDEYLILKCGNVFDIGFNRFLIEIVIMNGHGAIHTVTVDEQEHPDARLVVSRQCYSRIRGDIAE